MNSNNVVLFPKQKRNCPPNTIEEIQSKIVENRTNHIEYIVDEVMYRLIEFSGDEGYDLLIDQCEKPMGLLNECIKAALFKSINIEHDLHKVADEICITKEEFEIKKQQEKDSESEKNEL